MSGGAFDYKQHEILSIAEQIAEVILKNCTIRTYESIEPWDRDQDTGRIAPGTSPYCSEYSPETIKNMLMAYRNLRLGYEYAHQTDLLLEGDIGEETYNERLKEIIPRTENDVAAIWEKAVTHEPDHLRRCIFCDNCRLVRGQFYCNKGKTQERIKDPLVQTCSEFGSETQN